MEVMELKSRYEIAQDIMKAFFIKYKSKIDKILTSPYDNNVQTITVTIL